jgi:hypothetical protein
MRGLLRRRPRWTIVTAAPNTDGALQWGDTWFARDLADALTRASINAHVVTRGGATSPDRDNDDVVIVLRGLKRISPRRPRRGGPRWILWVISHPELVEAEELAEYDEVFAASATWQAGVVRPLLQATNAHRFTPQAGEPDTGADILFVGSTRGEFRPAVRAAVAAGVHAIFLECHPTPSAALSDASTMQPLDAVPAMLASLVAIRKAMVESGCWHV